METSTAEDHAPSTPTAKGSPSSPRLVTVLRKSDATGDAAHYKRQIVKRPWQ